LIALPSGTRVWLATGRTDMRKGFDGLALVVQEALRHDPHGGHLFVFRGRRGDLIKVLWHDGQGMCLFAKRLEKGRFIWPSPADGVVAITPAQLGYLLEGIDWRAPRRTWVPQAEASRSSARAYAPRLRHSTVPHARSAPAPSALRRHRAANRQRASRARVNHATAIL
jgi:transposase